MRAILSKTLTKAVTGHAEIWSAPDMSAPVQKPMATVGGLADLQAEAYQEAFAQGLAEGRDAGRVEVKAQVDRLAGMFFDLAKPFEVLDAEVEHELLTLAMALAPRIRVNAIGPGPTLPSRHQTAAQFAEQCARMPLRRGTTPEEISETVRFILAARAMTGQMIALDGGQHLGWAHLPVEPELS